MTQLSNPLPSLRGFYAGFVTRSIAFAIDLILIAVTQITILFLVRLLLDFFGLDQLARAIFEPTETTNVSVFITITRWVIAFIGSGFLFALYSISMWLLVDKTLGQALLGLRVLRTDGRPLTLGPAIRRVLGYYISFLALFLGFLWVLVDDRRQGWHDKIADTIVVYDWEARLGKRMREWLARRQAEREAPPPDIFSQG
ncbi:MAG TPA: RDD family protein [Promineifilum sp.]|nr:RDD family protein [Promineifilum sp.]HRO25669.1 RDD family protein [Promineifilum sp.]HRO91197.1 RDD family protein [Promineifilum sp.]HRQ14398.1 RDD family protein [Promineifilum sp.]